MKQLTLLFVLFSFACINVSAQDTGKAASEAASKAEKAAADAQAAKERKDKAAAGWVKKAEIGLNAGGMRFINPQVSDPGNQVNLGGLLDLFADYKMGKLLWENSGRLQLAALRNGGKKVYDDKGVASDNPFAKGADVLLVKSTAGYSISKNDKWFAGGSARLLTQMFPTFNGGLFNGPDGDLLSQFASPLSFSLAPSIIYKPNANLTFAFAPIGLDLTYVAEEALRTDGALGNEPGKASRVVLGPVFNANYGADFFEKKLGFRSGLEWVPNYRDNLNGRVIWVNALNVAVFKGLGLKLTGDAFYNHYSLTQVRNARNVVELKQRTTGRLGAFLTYATKF
jgi:hypothetical protein